MIHLDIHSRNLCYAGTAGMSVRCGKAAEKLAHRQVAELVGAIKTFAGPASEFHFAKKEYDIQKAPLGGTSGFRGI